MRGVHPPLTDQASTVRAEVVEVGPQFDSPSDPPEPFKEGKRNGLRLAWLVAVLIVGIAVMPGGQESTTLTTVNLTLPQPAIATSTIPVAPRSVAVVTAETFPLIPVADLNGFGHFAGPVEFAGRHWIAAGTARPSNSAVILSSNDGASWVTESEIAGSEPILVPQELIAFHSNLVLIATLSGPSERFLSKWDQSQTLVAWTSTDGRTWSLQPLPELEGRNYYDVRAAAGNDRLMVTAGLNEAHGELIQAAIPDEFQPAIAAGQLFTNWERRSDQLVVKVMAPPGLEVFSTDLAVTSPGIFYHSRTLVTENLITWDELEPPIGGISALAWSDEFGFIRQSSYGEEFISTDGHFWERTADLPPGDFRKWRDGLLGLIDTTGGTVDLLVVDNGIETRIGLPGEMFVANGYPWIEAGPDGLIAAITRYEISSSAYATVTVASGGLLLTLDNDVLVITKNGQDQARLPLWTPSAKAKYDPVTGLIEIPPGEGVELTTIPLEDLAAFWTPPPNSARTEFYQSSDGLTWSKGEAAIFSDGVTLIGGTDSGFLIGVGANVVAGWEEDMTVLRTGPID